MPPSLRDADENREADSNYLHTSSKGRTKRLKVGWMGVVPISGALPDRIGLSLIFPPVAKRSNDGRFFFFQFTPDLSRCPDVLSVRRLHVKPAERVTGLYH